MKTYRVRVAIVPPMLNVKLFGAKTEYKTVTVEAESREEAERIAEFRAYQSVAHEEGR